MARFGVKYTYNYETGSLVDGDRNYVYLTDSNDLWSLEFQTFGVSGNLKIGAVITSETSYGSFTVTVDDSVTNTDVSCDA